MTTSIVEIAGLDMRSSPLFMPDCSTPVLDWIKHCPPDDVLRNMQIVVGSWNSGTVVPAFTDMTVDIDTSEVCDPNCDSATVSAILDGCELMLPDMKDISLKTKPLNIKEWRDKFCKPRRIAPERFCVFNADGTLNEGEELIVDFAGMALGHLKLALAQLFSRSALVGDYSNMFEFDGLYTQIDNGWAPGQFGQCDDTINTGVTIDWGALTGKADGECASPDDVTVGGTITIWGNECNVPAGMTLAQFFEQIWLPKVQTEWTDARGGVDAWEMHLRHGQGQCFLASAACMQPCSVCGSNQCIQHDDVNLRERFADQRRAGIAELFPSMTRIPILQTKHVEENTMRLGPRSIGGFPTYVMFFQDIDEMLPDFPGQYGTGFGMPDYNSQLPMLRDDSIQFPLEERTLYWGLKRESLRCFEAEMMACAGLIACWRHLWLKVTNVCCCGCIEDCDTSLLVDGEPLGTSVPA